MGTGSRKSSHHQRSGSNPINPTSNSIPSHASAVSATSEDYVDMSPAGSGSGSRPGAVPIPNRNMSSNSLTFGTSPSAGKLLKGCRKCQKVAKLAKIAQNTRYRKNYSIVVIETCHQPH